MASDSEDCSEPEVSKLTVTVACCVVLPIVGICLSGVLLEETRSDEERVKLDDHFAPGETRLVSAGNSVIYSEATLEMKNESPKYPAALYKLHGTEPPRFTAHDKFTIDVIPLTIGAGKSVHWSYHLHKGSKFSMEYCLNTQYSPIAFYLISKGSHFRSWNDNHDNMEHVTDRVNIIKPCDMGKKLYKYAVTTSDNYYFVFYNPGSFPASAQALMLFERTLYNVSSPKTAGHCEAGPHLKKSHCSIDVSQDNPLIIVVSTPAKTNYKDTVHLTLCYSSSYTRLVNFLASLPLLLTVVPTWGLLCVFGLGYCCMHLDDAGEYRRVSRGYQRLPSESMELQSPWRPYRVAEYRPIDLRQSDQETELDPAPIDRQEDYRPNDPRQPDQETELDPAPTDRQADYHPNDLRQSDWESELDPAPTERQIERSSESAVVKGAAAMLSQE